MYFSDAFKEYFTGELEYLLKIPGFDFQDPEIFEIRNQTGSRLKFRDLESWDYNS